MTRQAMASVAEERAVPVARDRVTDRAAVFVLGFALQFNVLTSSFGLPFQRLSDLLPFLLIPWLGLRPAVIAQAQRSLAPLAGILGLIGLSLVLKGQKEAGDVYLTLVLLLYVVLAFILLVLFRDRRVENAFCAGLLAGLFASLAVLILASSGVALDRFGLAVPTDGLDEELKLFVEDKQGGLWASGNETGHVFALGGVAALLLSLRFRMKAIYLVYFGAVLASFPLTNNRSGLLMPLLFLGLLMRRNLRAGPILIVLGAVGALLVFASLTGEIPLPDKLAQAIEKRFAEDNHVSGNFDERFESGIGALRLVVEYPFGLGEIARRDALRAMTGLVTPHNGFISLALQSGVATALLLLIGILRVLTAPATFGAFLTYSAVFMVPSLMFEELSVNQYFLFFMAVILASLALTPSDGQET